jgi:hypothetical protein
VRDRLDFGKIYNVKRVRRWLFNGIAAAVSIVFCVIVIADRLTQGSNMRWFEVLMSRVDGSDRITHGLAVTTGRGVVVLQQYSFCAEADRPPPVTHLRYFGYGSDGPLSRDWGRGYTPLSRAGFGMEARRQTRSAHYTGIWGVTRSAKITHWFLAILMGIFPTIWLWRRCRTRVSPGFCAECGYDLRATPDRCPECGIIHAKKEIISN